jgi:hypothetical protein
MTLVNEVTAAAANSLAARWATGQWWLHGEESLAAATYAFDVVTKRCVCVTGYLLDGNDAPFWTRTINVGRDLYLPLVNEMPGADPQTIPAHHDEWIRTTGTDFASATPVSPLYWLRGATAASQVSPRRIRVTVSRDESIAAAHADEQDQVAESWEQLGVGAQQQFQDLTQLECTVELTKDATIRSADVTFGPKHNLAVEYQTTGIPVDIPIPDQAEAVPIAELLNTLGVPDLKPPRAHGEDANEPS